MKNDKYHSQYNKTELRVGYAVMSTELNCLPKDHKLRFLFIEAWETFKKDEWKYDGATFVKERYNFTVFELASFIHDYRNSCGYVSRSIDMEFVNIMILLNYNFRTIYQRYILTGIIVNINIARHKYYKTYKKGLPDNLIRLTS